MDESSPSTAAQVVDLLRRAYVERWSGLLHLDRGDVHRGLAVRDGQVVYAVSDVAGERLGDVLVRHGDVTADVVERADAAARSEGRRMGAMLVETGIIGSDQLEDAVATHVRATLYAALDELAGSPSFVPVEPGAEEKAGWLRMSRLSTGQLLLDAARRLEDPAVVREALGELDRKLVLGTDPRLRTHPVALTPADGFVLSRVDGTLSARELIGLIPLPAEETEKSLLCLLCTAAVAFAKERPGAGPAPKAHATSPPAPPPAASPATTPPATTPPASTPPATTPAATTPPAALPPSAPPAAAPPPTAQPTTRPPTAAAGTPQPQAATKAGPSAEEVRRLILETHESLAQRDHFEVLGITSTAEDAELRAAFARLARVLHPDACRDSILADVTAQREAVFARVREAYETLRDPRQRAGYEAEQRRRRPHAAASAPASGPDAGTPSRSSSPNPNDPPGQVIADGEELIQNAQYGEAIQLIEAVLPRAEGELRVRARVALARASMKYPESLRRAEAYLQEVLREDPAHVQDAVRLETYLLLGDIYRASALPVRAAAMYRKALTMQPRNRHATRGLAALDGPAPPPPPTGSLLGFRKKR